MDIGQEMPRHAHNSQFGGLLHCLALGWNHFVALVIFTFGDFWWTFSSPGAISSLQNYLYCQMLFAYTPLKWSVFVLSKIVFIIAFFFLTLIIIYLESKHSHENLSVCCLLLVAFFMALKSSRRGFQTLALGFHLHTDHLTSHKPSLSQTISLRFKIKIPVHVQY